MTYSQILQEDFAKKRRIAASASQVVDHVFVDAQILRSKRPFKKLNFKSYGLYSIVKIISPYAYQL